MTKNERIILNRIWRAAVPLLRQGRRYDLLHTRDIVPMAKIVARREKMPPLLLVSAAMLHDIGWGCIPKRYLRTYHSGQARRLHMRRGAIAAREILEKCQVDPLIISRVTHLVSVHDNPSAGVGKALRAADERLLRDIDYAWRFTARGFRKDVAERGIDAARYLDVLVRQADAEGRFRHRSTRRIVNRLVRERQLEINKKTHPTKSSKVGHVRQPAKR